MNKISHDKRTTPRTKPTPWFFAMEWIEMDGVGGWTSKDFCSRPIPSGSRVFVTSKRPTTAHFFSRKHIYCAECAKKILSRGVPDYFYGITTEPLPCGAKVTGDYNIDGGLVLPDYMPIESPRLFGRETHGGEIMSNREEHGDGESL